MKIISLTRGFVAMVDDGDFERVSALKWRVHTSSHNRVVHAQAHIFKPSGEKTTTTMHRFILGVSDPNIKIDHRDRNGLNNCRSNLRFCTTSQNTANADKCRTPKTSIYKGVCFERRPQRWSAMIQKDHQTTRLGYFSTQEEAARAYDKAALQMFGDFSVLNFPNESGVADNLA